MLNIGLNDETHASLCEQIGEDAATRMYMRYIQAFAVEVARLDPEEFYLPDHPSADALKRMLGTYESEMDSEFPQDVGEQLAEVLRSMARSWEGTTARLLRQAKGRAARCRAWPCRSTHGAASGRRGVWVWCHSIRG